MTLRGRGGATRQVAPAAGGQRSPFARRKTMRSGSAGELRIGVSDRARPGSMTVRGGFRMDPSVTKQKLKPGPSGGSPATRGPTAWQLTVFLLATALDAVITVVNPLLLRELIDHGIIAAGRGRRHRGRDRRRRGRAARRAPRLHQPLVLRADRRGPDLRPAHPGLRPRAAAAARVLHPRADRVAGQPAGRGRDGRAARPSSARCPRRVQRPVAGRPPDHHVLPVLAGQPDRRWC